MVANIEFKFKKSIKEYQILSNGYKYNISRTIYDYN